MKIYYINESSTLSISEIKAEILSNSLKINHLGIDHFLPMNSEGKRWARTKTQAVAIAEELKKKKIKYTKSQLEYNKRLLNKLESLNF